MFSTATKLLSILTLLGVFTLSAEEVNNFIINQLDKTSSHIKGPNRWNSALVAAGVLRYKRSLHPSEWLSHLENYCLEVQTPRYGDVGRLFHVDDYQEETEVHGFVYIDEDTIFAKHGEDVAYGYRVMSTEEMMKQYGRTRKCHSRNDFSTECYHKLKYYQCFGRHSLTQAEDEFLGSLEKLLFDRKYKKKYNEDCYSESFANRQNLLDTMIEQMSVIKLNPHASLNTKEAKLSILHQIGHIKSGYMHYKCKKIDGKTDRDRKYSKINKLRDFIFAN